MVNSLCKLKWLWPLGVAGGVAKGSPKPPDQ